MKLKKTILIGAFFSFSVLTHSQTNQDTISNTLKIVKIEDFILNQQLDSASFYLAKQKESNYIKILDKIVANNDATYSDYYQFISKVGNRPRLEYNKISNFINQTIKTPNNENDINSDFIEIKWSQVSKLRDEVTIEAAAIEYAKLDTYINKFDQAKDETIKARLLANTHQIVLYQIQQDVDNGLKLCLDSFDKAKALGDKRLMIVFLYHSCDFYIIQGKLDKYIATSEESIDIEKELQKHSSYYYGTLIHLIDAYIYKGGKDERIKELLSELYNDPKIKAESYSLYAKYLGTLDPKSVTAISIFEQFEVSNLIEFAKKTLILGEPVLNPNNYFHLLNENADALARGGYTKEAIKYKDQCVILTRKIYSEDLSQSLATFKTEQAVSKKELEIKHEKEYSRLYIIIASLIGFLFAISMFVLARMRKISKELVNKNNLINKSLKEKELLVKEVHHRVKNNFQIISSLLELKTKGIEDEKALKMAVEGQNRIKSMALIHQKLYQNEEGLIDFDEYIHQLVKELSSLFASNKKVITNISSNNMMFDIDTAIPLGLIINELITNAYKYAFKNNENNQLNIAIDKVDKSNYKLTISDNGEGLNPAFNIKKAKSLGLRLVNRLAKQLHGTVTLINKKGANFEILFKDIHARKNINQNEYCSEQKTPFRTFYN